MPYSLIPGFTLWMPYPVPAEDAATPIITECPPDDGSAAVLVRCLSVADDLRFTRLLDAGLALSTRGRGDALAPLESAISLIVAEVHGFPDAGGRAATPDDLPDLLTRDEAWELVTAARRFTRPSDVDRQRIFAATALRLGEFCQGCTPGRSKGAYCTISPGIGQTGTGGMAGRELTCLACRGERSENCRACGGDGSWVVPGCVNDFVDSAAVTAMLAAERARKGRWPAGGVWLNESAGGLEAIEFAVGVREQMEGEIRQSSE